MVYVMSDIHGEYDKFIKMLELINFSKKDILYILGDVVDRGKFPIKTLLHIMENRNMNMILGNHEEFMLDYFSRNKNIPTDYMIYEQQFYETWFSNGGVETCRDLRNYREQFDNIIDCLKSLPLTKTLLVNGDIFTIAHANLEIVDGEISPNQIRDVILWERRNPSINQTLKKNNYLITGHTPTYNLNAGKSTKIFKKESWICIDGGAVFGGALTCLRLDDMKEFYI